jgi:RHS repeat-associated protein
VDFDERGILERVEGPGGRWIQYTSNDAGRRGRMETNDGFVLDYDYDDAGRLEYLKDETGFEIVRYHYDEAGRIEREDRGNGTSTVYTYDAGGKVLTVTHHAPDESVQSFFNYTYDPNGNPETMTTADGIAIFEYDEDGHLESVTYPSGGVVGYEYDAAGNRVVVTDDGAVTDYEVNDLNQYTGVGATIFTYDDDGNLETRIDGEGTTTFSWDPESRLTSIATPAHATWTFAHDVFGRRLAADHDDVSRQFVHDPRGFGDVVAEYDGSGDLVARYIHGLGLVARMDASGGPAYYSYDAIGNTRQVTDTAGAVVNSYDYGPFGIALDVAETVPNPFRFGGRFGVMDDGHGLLHMRARYYDPATGRFLSPDPIGLRGGPNLYSYVSNSPLRYCDPAGLRGETGYERFYRVGKRRNDLFWMIMTGEAEDMGEAFRQYGEARQEYSKAASHMAWEVAKDAAMGWAVGPFYRNYPNGAFAFEWGKAYKDAYTHPPKPYWGHGNSPRDSAASGSTNVIYPVDPNEKSGPPGIGPDRIVVAGEELPYTVYFENLPAATAPAQEVFVADCLDHNLDWTTFRVREVEFGDVVVSNSDQKAVFGKRVGIPDFRDEVDKEWWVDVATEIDLATGCFKATLRQLDPETGDLPEDPFAGFLPPEDGSGRGQGHVSYSVSSKDDLEDGRLIRNKASIVFDTNEAIWTNEVVNTVGPQMWNLELSLGGDGTGTVTSAPVGIDCGATCQAYFVDGVEVELTATPGHASLFAGWSGDDDCADGTVTADADVACTATFNFVTDIFADGFESGDTTAWSEEATE